MSFIYNFTKHKYLYDYDYEYDNETGNELGPLLLEPSINISHTPTVKPNNWIQTCIDICNCCYICPVSYRII